MLAIEHFKDNSKTIMKKAIKFCALFTAWGLAILPSIATAVPAPQLTISTTNAAETVTLGISNLTNGTLYHIEHEEQLDANNWQDIYAFTATTSDTNWAASATNATGFFRVLAEPLNAKIGQVATFQEYFHGVAGTAHIVDEHTIELRNFYYDGTGIDIRVIVSPNASFSPYTIISGNLLGPAYSNATLTYTLPGGVNLEDVNYISIWCVPLGINFGDGMFQ